jgi:hypothetical protein
MSKILNKILEISQENEELWNYTNGVLPLFSKCICEQDGDYTHFGITKNKKGKFVFCYADGKRSSSLTKDSAIPLGMKDFKEELTSDYNLSTVRVKIYFLEEIKEPLIRYETEKAKIKEKVRKKMKKLEEELDN